MGGYDELESFEGTFVLPVLPTSLNNDDDIRKKGLWQRVKDRYSTLAQIDRIKRAEELFQAATRQASRPYVSAKLSVKNVSGLHVVVLCPRSSRLFPF